MTDTPEAPGDLTDLQQPLREIKARFQSTIESHRPDLYRYCLRLTGCPFDAEDLVQETLTRAFGRLCQHYQPLEPRPYLFRIATNVWIDQYRRARRLVFEPIPEHMPSAASSPEESAAVEEALAVLADTLEPRQRVALLLKDVFGFPVADIAEFLETTPGAVKALLHRARGRVEHQRSLPKRAVNPSSLALARRYAERLNASDWDGIAALLRADATVSIVGVDEEHGREYIRATSLADSERNPLPGNRADMVLLDDEPVILWLFQPEDGFEAVRDVLRISTDGESITHVWMYWYCPDVVREVGNRLGYRAEPEGLYTV